MMFSKGDIVVTCVNPFQVFVLTGETTGQNLIGIKLSGGCNRYKIKPSDVKYTLAKVNQDSQFFTGDDGNETEQDEIAFEQGMQHAKLMAGFDPSWVAASQLEKHQVIVANGKPMRFVGIKPGSPKYPIIVEASDGKRYKLPLRMAPK